MLFTMLCCSYPFERKEDDDNDPRTQTKVMQRILKGKSLHGLAQPMGPVNSAPSHCAFHITMQRLWCPTGTCHIHESMLLAHVWTFLSAASLGKGQGN